jgi:hypothetical protein
VTPVDSGKSGVMTAFRAIFHNHRFADVGQSMEQFVGNAVRTRTYNQTIHFVDRKSLVVEVKKPPCSGMRIGVALKIGYITHLRILS